MKKDFLVLLVSSITIAAFGQQSLHDIRKKGRATFVYKLPVDSAEKYLTTGMTSIDHFMSQIPFTNFNSDSVKYNELPTGNYLLLSVEDNELVAEYFCRTKTKVYPINNQHRVQLNIVDGLGNHVSNASVWVNKENAKYNHGGKTYSVTRNRPGYAVVKVIQPGDTSFFDLSASGSEYLSPFRQRWRRFKGTRVGRVVLWVPERVRRMVNNPPRYWFRKQYRNRAEGKGYVVFNKPRYLPTDTVKFKAYILNKKGKRYNNDVNVSLNYYKNSKRVVRELVKLRPVSKGAYLYKFVIGDSMPSDTRINVDFRSTKDQGLLRSVFYIEDYLLDEVASHAIRSEKENYYKNDSMTFFTSAKDANGLSLMDGKVNLILRSTRVKKFYNDRVFVSDTLWQEEKTLLTEGETKFSIPTNNFPAAELELSVTAIFRNSNNEIRQKDMNISFTFATNDLVVDEDNGILSALYYENGQPVSKEGWMENDNTDKPVLVQFPFIMKIDPHIVKYQFFLQDEKGKKVLEKSFEPEAGYRISFNRVQAKDTVGFTLFNPKKIPVYYTIFNGNRIIESASDSNQLVKWSGHISTGRTYKLKWQYYWAGKERYGEESIVLLSKLATTEIRGRSTVYPGQTDTIAVSMKDYRGRPVVNANLTVASYNTQFGRIAVPEPPYIEKFRSKLTVQYDRYEADAAGYFKRFLLGEHKGWRTRFLLDTMPYYNFLFPGKNYHMVRTRIDEALPQVAIHVVKKGVPQEIYILYINRQPVYYNEATDQPPYSYEVYPGFAQISFRLRDKYVQIDSIYMQPYYKHDIAFDLDSLPPGAKVMEQKKYLSWEERSMLENRMLRLENNHRNNFGFVWQGGKVVFLNGTKEHSVGPFQPLDSIRFFKPRDFHFSFQFEPGYRYRVSPGVVRLEKMKLFPDWQKNVYLQEIKKAKWKIGDTILSHPAIVYSTGLIRPYLDLYGHSYKGSGPSRILIEPVKDSVIAYTIIHSNDTSDGYRVLAGKVYDVSGLNPGRYNVILVTRSFNIAEEANIEITAAGKYCVRFSNPVFNKSNSFIKLLQLKQEKRWRFDEEQTIGFFDRGNPVRDVEEQIYSNAPGRTISGTIIDEKGGSPIPFASIIVKGTRMGVTSDAEGRFVIRNVPYNATLVVACVGYDTYEIQSLQSDLGISMRTSSASLSEVVVTAYGMRRQRSLGFSVSREEISGVLQGKVAGVQLSGIYTDSIRIRGFSSLNNNYKPLIVINGLPMDELPENFDTTGLSINILKADVAVSLYGSRAANGVIMITTNDFNPKTIRNQFRDYAFWQPNLFTGNDGEVKFAVTYPDNITSWQTYVVGMDRKNRMTKSSFFTKAFKPLLAQLSTPQFFIEGDSAVLIGKGVNYTTSAAFVKTNFSIGGNTVKQDQIEITANSSFVEELRIKATGLDTINAQYTIKTAAGFSDGEERKIPVFRKGIEEAIGNFWVFNSDTTVSFLPDKAAGLVKLYAQNNTLEVLLDEISHLKEYPFYCMEQTASKLKGLIAEKKIRESLGQRFTGEKEMNKLLAKLQKGQQFNGSWGWWQEGIVNLPITNYVIRTLLPLRKDPLVESNIRNGLLYLQNNLRGFKTESLLNALYTMSEAGHYMEYRQYLDKINFDSLSLHEQWTYIRIKQQQKMDHERELRTVMDKKVETILGGLHWGNDSYSWENNSMATTALAFRVLENEENHKEMVNSIIQYFLERRSGGRWRNTVESAVTVETILPTILKTRSDFTANATLSINGISTSKFPHSQTVTNDGRPISISKSGGGLMYFTAWQTIFNTEPGAVTDKFKISTWFEKNGNAEAHLKAGEKIKMKIRIEVLKDADYVQIEIPIPAGCTYAEKKQDEWRMHKEFYKNKLVMFAEKMNKGTQNIEIELEPRYTGNFNLNPAKAELMYFPVFYGRNEMKPVEIKR